MTTASTARAGSAIDPVTFEVIRHRLQSINEEQAVALKAVSGSPIVSEADDYNTGLYLPDGELVAMGRTVIYNASSMSEMVKHVIADCGPDPGIGPGDSFVLNSPHKGALHAPDFAILHPIFHADQLIAWTGACAHQMDIGGMEHGGFMPQARDIYQEGLLIPPVKLVDAGRIRSDVWAMITGMSRLPEVLSLNLRGMIAANRVGAEELAGLISRYGLDVVMAVMAQLLDLSEARMRSRLAELPDGRFRARRYLDHDGHENTLHTVQLTLTKRGDLLDFDFTGTGPEARGFVNCTRTGLIAGVYAAVLPHLAYDMPWNGGVFRRITITCPPRTLLTAEPPTPCSQGPLGGIWLAEIAAIEAVSKLLATHPHYLTEAQASPAGGVDLFNPSGIDQYGDYSGWILLDQMQTGGGAYIHRDGLSPQGHHCITKCRVPNVESQEQIAPLLWLYRRLITDSPGAGRRQGGQSAAAAMTPHHAHWLRAAVGGHGFESPTAAGIFGGYPARCNERTVVRGSDFWSQIEAGRVPSARQQLSGTVEHTAAKAANFMLQVNDVLFWLPQAGGGWGDPLERDPAEVARDLTGAVISPATAERVYGVVISAGGIADEQATRRLRDEIRRCRRGWPHPEPEPGRPPLAAGAVLAPLGDALRIVATDDGAYTACRCGHLLGPAAANWKDCACANDTEAADLGAGIRLHQELVARQYACPGCGLLLDLEISRGGEAPLHDMEVVVDVC